jgi:hypothetical protein
MSTTLTPLDRAEINKITKLLAKKLAKINLPSDGTKVVINDHDDALVDKLLEVVCHEIEESSDLIYRRVKVNSSLTFEDALKATRCYFDIPNEEFVRCVPNCQKEESEVLFFRVNSFLYDEGLAEEYERRGLIPADPYSLAKVNEDNLTFMNERPNATHWKDAQGRWCIVSFDCFHNVRRVSTSLHVGQWPQIYWFAGIRK